MTPATAPRTRPARLLHVSPALGQLAEHPVHALPALLRPHDLVVVNDAATLPASLRGHTDDGTPVELRLLAQEGEDLWTAVLFGAGDWRTRTEDRPAPPRLERGARLRLGSLEARVAEVLPPSPRLVRVLFDARREALWERLYREGRPVQYAHLSRALALWDVQTAYAGVPWAAEAPSAGLFLDGELLLALRRRGVRLATLTHAAGLSSTGDAALDAALPRPERSRIPAATIAAVEQTRALGGRVVAVGTTVVRALEGRALAGGGRLGAGETTTDVLLGPGFRRRVVDGLLSGMHETGTSHFALLQAFAPAALLTRAVALAEARGFTGHEFGDACLVLD